jgi:hypothetical protein
VLRAAPRIGWHAPQCRWRARAAWPRGCAVAGCQHIEQRDARVLPRLRRAGYLLRAPRGAAAGPSRRHALQHYA